LLLLQDIALTFGAAPLLSGAGLAVAAGDRICLVGRNGSGKSTLLGIAAGLVQADAGERFAQPGTTIQYLPQEPDLAGFATALAYVEAGFDAIAADGHHRALYLLKELGLCGNEDPASLSGGEARRAALALALAPSPDILLLDEPTNHLDLPGIEWLERELAELRSGVVLISHDRRLLERFSLRTVWLDRGITRVLEQGFASFESWRDTVLEFFAADGHWTRGRYDDGKGGHCLVGALLYLGRKHRLPTAPAIAAAFASFPARQAVALHKKDALLGRPDPEDSSWLGALLLAHHDPDRRLLASLNAAASISFPPDDMKRSSTKAKCVDCAVAVLPPRD
jgi:ABC-type nitrate/sulfonate/bicarbonate transport system ATPase subunit